MKKHASGLQVGAYVVGGLVGVYLLGFLVIYLDAKIFGGDIGNSLPEPIRDVVVLLYYPFAEFLKRTGFL